MTPKNSSNRKDTCAEVSSNCTIWEGPDLPCIQLCKGDSVTDAIHKFATDYCEFKDSLDLTDFDLSCIFEACQACPEPDKSLKNVLGLLRDKICSLEDIIDGLNPGTTTPTEPFDVNLKCLAITDGNGNILNDDSQNAQVQAIIDRTCTNSNSIGLLENEAEDHEDRITALENATDDDQFDVTSDCLFIGTKPIDQAYELLDADYCEFKGVIGQPVDVQSAIGQACAIPALVGNPAFIVNPSNLAESFNNLWLAYCNLASRIQLIEENCCKTGCDDIKIGFSTVFNEDSTVTLNFNAGTGTNIPSGWTDYGSILTITDGLGNSFTTMLNIVNNYTSPDIDLTSFHKGSQLTFSLDVKMKTDTDTCQKCVTKTVTYSGGDCCVYTNTSGSSVTIVYETQANA